MPISAVVRRGIRGADPLRVIGLEDRLRERLRRTVVDLLCEAGALGFLRLHDAHRDVPIAVGRDHECGVAALQEKPGAGQRLLGELEARERRAMALEFCRQGVDVVAERACVGIARARLGCGERGGLGLGLGVGPGAAESGTSRGR